ASISASASISATSFSTRTTSSATVSTSLARLEASAAPGGICVIRVVRDQVRDKLAVPFEDMGEHQVKNIARPVRAYRALLAERADRPSIPSDAAPRPLPDRPSIAVLPFHNVS